MRLGQSVSPIAWPEMSTQGRSSLAIAKKSQLTDSSWQGSKLFTWASHCKMALTLQDTVGIDTRELAQTRSSADALIEADAGASQFTPAEIYPTTLMQAAASYCGVEFRPILSEQRNTR